MYKEILNTLNKYNITLKEMAGCNYCFKNISCNIYKCALENIKKPFYYKWHKFINEMITINQINKKDLAKLIGLTNKEFEYLISGYVNPQNYKNHNYQYDLLYHIGCTTTDINDNNIKEKFLLKYKIKIFSKILIE